MQPLSKLPTASSMSKLPTLSLDQVFDASRTLKSINVAKDKFQSSENILEVPVTYDLNGLKVQKSDANKLLMAIQNYYRDGERLDQYKDEMDRKLEAAL